MAAIDPTDPQRGRKAFKVFLETVLIDELGADLGNDAGFHQLIDRVHRDMESDPRLAALIDEASTVLLANVPSSAAASTRS